MFLLDCGHLHTGNSMPHGGGDLPYGNPIIAIAVPNHYNVIVSSPDGRVGMRAGETQLYKLSDNP